MLPQKIDFFFPFLIFLYGFLLLVVLEALPAEIRQRLSSHGSFQQILQRKSFAWTCFFVGGLWSLQNLWNY